jgi:hypothetical protein
VLCAIAASCALHFHTTGFGFDYDDYHLLRPYSGAEVLRAFAGSWDPTGVEVAFYRPLTTAFYAARFWVLGFDAFAYHLLGLVLFGLAAGLFGLAIAALTDSTPAGLLGVLMYVVHPAMPRAQIVWATNQMHLLASILTGAAFVWWAMRGRFDTGRWWVLLPLAGMVFLLKEDNIMLLPFIVLLQVLHRLCGPSRVPWPRRSWLAGASVLIAALLIGRWMALGGLGGYAPPPTLAGMWANYERGAWLGFLAWRSDTWVPWRYVQWFVVLVFAGALLPMALGRSARTPPLRVGLLGGVLGAALFNLPFVLVTKPEQYHLVASCSALALTSGVLMLFHVWRSTAWRAAVGAATAAGLVALTAGSWHRSDLFRPDSAFVRGHDQIVLEWAAVPPEIKTFLRAKLAAPEGSGPPPALAPDVVIYGAYDVERHPDGRPFRWLASQAALMLGPQVESVTLSLEPEFPKPEWTHRVDVHTSGAAPMSTALDEPGTYRLTLPSVRGWRRWFQGTRRIDVSFPGSWRPSDVWPGATDTRELSVRLSDVAVSPKRD